MSSSAPHLRRAAGLAFLLLCLVAHPSAARAQSLSSTSNPATLRISTTTAGAGSGPATSTQSGRITITTPGPNRTYKITARLTSGMPAGATLTIEIPGVGSNLGPVTLSTTAVDVVSGIGRNTNISPLVTYRLSAPLNAGTSTGTRSVELVIVQY